MTARNSAGQFAKVRAAPPDLEFRCPDCPICDKETGTDGDSFVCEGCGCSWGRDGTGGSWDEPGEIACPSVVERYNRPDLDPKHEILRHMRDRCILADDGHIKHRGEDSWVEWDDDSPYIVAGRRRQ